jgi:hypothetical protein
MVHDLPIDSRLHAFMLSVPFDPGRRSVFSWLFHSCSGTVQTLVNAEGNGDYVGNPGASPVHHCRCLRECPDICDAVATCKCRVMGEFVELRQSNLLSVQYELATS